MGSIVPLVAGAFTTTLVGEAKKRRRKILVMEVNKKVQNNLGKRSIHGKKSKTLDGDAKKRGKTLVMEAWQIKEKPW